MWFPITTLAVLACIFGARRCEQRSPLTLALYAWAILLVLCTPVFFTYSVKYSLQADAFIAACLSALTAAFLLVRRPPRRAPVNYQERPRAGRLACCHCRAGWRPAAIPDWHPG